VAFHYKKKRISDVQKHQKSVGNSKFPADKNPLEEWSQEILIGEQQSIGQNYLSEISHK